MPHNKRLTREPIYADDINLIFDTQEEVLGYILIISNILKQWNLKDKVAKTEIITVETHERNGKR